MSVAVTPGAGATVNAKVVGGEQVQNVALTFGNSTTATLVEATVGLPVALVGATPAGTNAIGKLAANSGVDIGDVDVASIVPGTGVTNLGKAVDSVSSATDTGVAALLVRDDALATLTPVDGDYTHGRANARGALWVALDSTVAQTVTLAASTAIIGTVMPEGTEYETVAASQTAQTLGATGATGDYIAGILVIPATLNPGVVTLLDNAISIPVFVGGTSSVSNLVPFLIPLGIKSVSGAWKITTGSSVSCVGTGNFT